LTPSSTVFSSHLFIVRHARPSGTLTPVTAKKLPLTNSKAAGSCDIDPLTGIVSGLVQTAATSSNGKNYGLP
jgi:hypothetical protein